MTDRRDLARSQDRAAPPQALAHARHACPSASPSRASRRCRTRTSCSSSSPTKPRAATASPSPCAPSAPTSIPPCSSKPGTTTAKVTFDRALLNELASLRFLDAHAHVAIVGPVGVGKTFLAHALGHIACRRGAHRPRRAGRPACSRRSSTRASINSYEAELRKLLAVDLLILDDFGLDALDATESRDAYEILTERHRAGSIDRHLEPRPRRMARHLRRSRPRPERHRPLHQQRLRPRHRRRVVPAPAQTQALPRQQKAS